VEKLAETETDGLPLQATTSPVSYRNLPLSTNASLLTSPYPIIPAMTIPPIKWKTKQSTDFAT
jgi:hypothetical protein